MPAPHLETQQHLSNVLCVNLQTNLSSLISQQHSFTSFPVSLQTIFFGAAQHPTSDSEEKFASIRVIRGYRIGHQRFGSRPTAFASRVSKKKRAARDFRFIDRRSNVFAIVVPRPAERAKERLHGIEASG
jgi:hypothetical protein